MHILPIPNFVQGTIPFLSRSLLKQISHTVQEFQAKRVVYRDDHITSMAFNVIQDLSVQHMPQDYIESQFYVTLWMMVMYDGPSGLEWDTFNFNCLYSAGGWKLKSKTWILQRI